MRYRIMMMVEVVQTFITSIVNRLGPRPSTNDAQSSDLWTTCGRPVGGPMRTVDGRQIRWITLWNPEIPLDLVLFLHHSLPTDSFGQVVHRQVGGGSICPTRDTGFERFGEGAPLRLTQVTATA